MKVRDVYLVYTWIGFREISKEKYIEKVLNGYERDMVDNQLTEDPSITWKICICYPKVFSSKAVYKLFEKNHTMYTGIYFE